MVSQFRHICPLQTLFLQYKDNTGNRKVNKYWQIIIWLSQLTLYDSYVKWCDLAFNMLVDSAGLRVSSCLNFITEISAATKKTIICVCKEFD